MCVVGSAHWLVIELMMMMNTTSMMMMMMIEFDLFDRNVEHRGQPITTSAGKWLQLMLTISDVVDLSRFRFDLTYRVVRSDVGNLSPSASAVAQLSTNGNGSHNGASTASTILWYGDPVPGTLCSRNLHSCDQRTCILQSPNFPGLYPRYGCMVYTNREWLSLLL